MEPKSLTLKDLVIGSRWWHKPDVEGRLHTQSNPTVYPIIEVSSTGVRVKTPGGVHREEPLEFLRRFLPVIEHIPEVHSARVSILQFVTLFSKGELPELLVESNI